MTQRTFVPSGTYDWRGDAKHELTTLVWYPAAGDTLETPQPVGPPGRPYFDIGPAAVDATVATAPKDFPLIVLSHGTGGSAVNLVWFAEALAGHGYIAAAVNHPGNNAIDGYTVPGFTLWWLRARDLSSVIEGLLADPTFGPRIDPRRIGAAGHSLGGYTVLALAGGIAPSDRLREFCRTHQDDETCKPLNEFPDLVSKAEGLARSDPIYRAARALGDQSYGDSRVRAVFGMAPALGPAFLTDSLAHIDIPVALVTGAGDEVVPVASVQAVASEIPNAELTVLPAPVGHYVFIGLCLDAARTAFPLGCNDPPGVDRAAVLAETAEIAQAFFARRLR